MKYFVHTDADGIQSFFSRKADEDQPDDENVQEVPRMPEMGEKWVAGAWSKDGAAANALTRRADHDDKARTQKGLEAILITSGIKLTTGLLVAEAADKGMKVEDLAAVVRQKVKAFEDAELQRQKDQGTV